MKVKFIFLVFLLVGMASFAQEASPSTSLESYHGIELLISNPPLQFNRFQPDFGHEYIRSGSVPVAIGAGWIFRGKKRFGGGISLLYVPLNFDIDYNYIGNPDPLIPAFSEFRNDYLSMQALLDFALIRKEKIEISLRGGLDFLLLINYAESTLFTNDDLGTDRFRDSFSGVLGAVELGAGGRYFIGNRVFIDLEAVARYYTAPLESMEFTDLRNPPLGVQLGLGCKLGGK